MTTPPVHHTQARTHQRRSTFFKQVQQLINRRGISPKLSGVEYYSPRIESRRDLLPAFKYPRVRKLVTETGAEPNSPSYAISPPRADMDSSFEGSHTSSAIFVALAGKGFVAFRVVVLKQTGDVFALCKHEATGDRVAVYIPESLVGGEAAIRSTRARVDSTSEKIIADEEEAMEVGAFELAITAGVAAAAIDLSPRGSVIGVLTASANDENNARYFALMCRSGSGDETPRSMGSRKSEGDVFIFAQTEGAAAELEKHGGDGVHATPRAVFPVVHYNSACAEGLHDEVRTATLKAESAVVSESLTFALRGWEEHAASVRKMLADTSGLVHSCLLARERLSVKNGEAMATYSAKMQEIVGSLWASVSEAASAGIEAAKTAKASLYLETRGAIMPGVVPSRNPNSLCVRASNWGVPVALDGIDISTVKGTLDAALVDGVGDSLREMLIRRRVGMESTRP